MELENIKRKISRLRAGHKPIVLDLFSGCGGLSLGFYTAGFNIAAAVENDPIAANSHANNFHKGARTHSVARDITCTTPEGLVEELGLGRVEDAFDVIIGGPPCQAFARIGRPKLREIEAHPEAFKNDARARLYIEYLRFVEAYKPLVVLMENVPDVLNHGGQNIPEEICEVLMTKGYICGYTLLNSAFYGVPQMRERMFLIAYRQELSNIVSFPKPTHWIKLPPGYNGTRATALRHLRQDTLDGLSNCYIPPPAAQSDLPNAITVEEAIGDLPSIMALKLLSNGKIKRGTRKFDKLTYYDPARNVSKYAQIMREWQSFESKDGVCDHVIRFLPRDYRIFSRLSPGDQYPEAHAHALDIFQEQILELKKSGIDVKPGTKEYTLLKRSIVPPYDTRKFPNKWRKMWCDKPARTLMAHLGKDSYSHIHYDSQQARTISVREAARLQSFPDGFVFSGTMNSAFRQIGNAVPPIMAYALAQTIRQTLGLPEIEDIRKPIMNMSRAQLDKNQSI